MKIKNGMYIIDEQFKIQYLNKYCKEIYPDIKEGDICFEKMSNNDSMCPDCPLRNPNYESTFYNKKFKTWINASSTLIDYNNNPSCKAIMFKSWRENRFDDILGNEEISDIANIIKNNTDTKGIIVLKYSEGLPIIFANNKFLDNFKYDSFEDFMLQTNNCLVNIIHEDDLEETNSIINQNLVNGMVFQVVCRLKTKDNKYIKAINKGQIFLNKKKEKLALIIVEDISELMFSKLTTEIQNEILLKQNELLRYFNEYAPGGFARCRLEKGFPFTYVSRRLTQMIGFSEDEIKLDFNNLFINLIHPDDVSKFLDIDFYNNDNESLYNILYRIKHKTKDYIWVKENIQLVKYNDELYLQGTILEITDEMQKHFNLVRQNNQLNIIVKNLPGGFKISCKDQKLSFKSITKEAVDLFGYSLDEIKSRFDNSALDLICEPDRKQAIREIKKCIKGSSKDYSVKYRVICKDGSVKTVIDCGVLGIDEDNEEVFYSYYLDITKEEKNQEIITLQNRIIDQEFERRKQREESIKQKELIYALSKDYNTVYFVDLDKDEFRLLYSNLAVLSTKEEQDYYKISTYSLSVDKYLFELIHPNDREEAYDYLSLEKIKKKIITEPSYTYNLRVLKNDVISYYQVKVVKVGDDDKNNCVVIGHKNVDEKTKQSFKQQELLEDALSRAQYASKAKTVFLNNMSHDIRTPMNAIMGFTELARNNLDDKDKVKDYLKKISQSSTHLLSLINDVLDMSRIESGKMKFDEKPENLADIMHNIKNIVQSDINAKHLEFNIDTVDIVDEEIICDKLRINQMLLNLLSNAIKFTKPNGVISLTITQTAVLENGYASYEFRIKDNGIGMSEDFVKHIFEPFARERTSTVSGIQGTGLGMSITKSIVDMLNGTIEARSELGKGSLFIVNLDFKLQREHQEIPMVDSLLGLRCLVVDDDLSSCQSVSKMLRQIGLRAEWTMYGKESIVRTMEAIEIDDPYSLYVIDWLMPDMNGIETVRRLRKLIGNKPPIIILTAYDWSDIEKEAKEAGVNKFVSKPLFISDLKRTLTELINDSKNIDEENDCESFKGYKILLVEDNILNQEIANQILIDHGFEVTIAQNGLEAIDILKLNDPEKYNLILMDIQMPIMDGYEATRRIKKMKNKTIRNIPIVAMTANAFDEDIKESLEAGMVDHLSKPFEIKKLIEVLKNNLKQ